MHGISHCHGVPHSDNPGDSLRSLLTHEDVQPDRNHRPHERTGRSQCALPLHRRLRTRAVARRAPRPDKSRHLPFPIPEGSGERGVAATAARYAGLFSGTSLPLPPAAYKHSFDLVKQNLLAGNSYLTNLTCRVPVSTNLTMEEIFLHSEALYKLWLKDRFVCFSPEIFVRIEKGKIKSFPMKGTIDATLPDAESAFDAGCQRGHCRRDTFHHLEPTFIQERMKGGEGSGADGSAKSSATSSAGTSCVRRPWTKNCSMTCIECI